MKTYGVNHTAETLHAYVMKYYNGTYIDSFERYYTMMCFSTEGLKNELCKNCDNTI